jgi:hypothetical protein
MVCESDDAMDAIACGTIGGTMDGVTLVTGPAEAGVPGHVGFAPYGPEGEQTGVTAILGHGLSPISAAEVSDGSDHSEMYEAAHEDKENEVDSHELATPEA